ncbi:MAG: ATP-binding protein [Ahrensia sp.]|nr:ATP-binding protein [Ahrensia sp.]
MFQQFSLMMKTTAARLSALYFVLFILCAVFLVFYMTNLATSFLRNQTQQALAAEIDDLNRVFNRGGLRGLVRIIDGRSRRPDAFVYLVVDQENRTLAGNVAKLDQRVLANVGWQQRPFRYTRIGEINDRLEDDSSPRAIGQVFQFTNGLKILVGRDLGEPERFQHIIRRSLGIALGVMAIGGFLIWFFVGRHALLRIDRVSAASARIVGGDLSERLPVTAANDEFDRLSASLNGMLGRIETLNSGLRDVSDSIAHDLKTPLTRLRNRAEAALRTGKTKEEYRQALNDMIEESDHLLRIFNAMLLISRVEAGYSKHVPDVVTLSEIVLDLAELYAPVLEDSGGAISSQIEDDLAIMGNRELIGQALTNLIDNAIKYGNKSGPKISLIGRRTKDEKFIELIVRDNGVGIPIEQRDRVLERFVRLDESRSEAGSGLGLSLVAAIMKLHKGTITLDEANPGLEVVLSFPAK